MSRQVACHRESQSLNSVPAPAVQQQQAVSKLAVSLEVSADLGG